MTTPSGVDIDVLTLCGREGGGDGWGWSFGAAAPRRAVAVPGRRKATAPPAAEPDKGRREARGALAGDLLIPREKKQKRDAPEKSANEGAGGRAMLSFDGKDETARRGRESRWSGGGRVAIAIRHPNPTHAHKNYVLARQ